MKLCLLNFMKFCDILKAVIPYFFQLHKGLDEEETTAKMIAYSQNIYETQSSGLLTHIQEIIMLELIHREISNFTEKMHINSSSSIRDALKNLSLYSSLENSGFEENF